MYTEYKKLSEKEEYVIIGEKLVEYKYCDMDQVIAVALESAKKELI